MFAGLAVDCSESSLTWVEAIRPPLDETHSLSYLNKFINVNRVIRSVSKKFCCKESSSGEGKLGTIDYNVVRKARRLKRLSGLTTFLTLI